MIFAQNKTSSCTDFKAYIYTYPGLSKNKSQYWYILRFKGGLMEDCEIRYQTANKTSNFNWPTSVNRKTLKKGETEYVISKNGFFYGEYNDKHRVFSYALSKKFPKNYWSNASKEKYKSLPWKVTTDTPEKKHRN